MDFLRHVNNQFITDAVRETDKGILWIIVRLMENYGIQQVEATTAITGSGCAGKTRLDTGKQEVAAQRDDRGRGE